MIEKGLIALYWTPVPAPASFSSATGDVGKGPRGRPGCRADACCISKGTVLGAGAAGSGLLELLLTVAYVEGLSLDASPQQLTAEACQALIGEVQVKQPGAP